MHRLKGHLAVAPRAQYNHPQYRQHIVDLVAVLIMQRLLDTEINTGDAPDEAPSTA